MQQEPLAALPDLEREPLRVLVRHRRVLQVDLVRLLADAHREQRRALREVRVEDLLDLVVGLDEGGRGHRDPHDRQAREQNRDEACAHAATERVHAASFGIR